MTVASERLKQQTPNDVLRDTDILWKDADSGDGISEYITGAQLKAAFVTVTQTVLNQQAVLLTGDQTIAGAKTFSIAPIVPDSALSVFWEDDFSVPTKNSLFDYAVTVQSNFTAITLALNDLEEVDIDLQNQIDALGSAALTGTITKTLDPIGGDFETVAELQTWINSNTFRAATVTINVSGDTFTTPVDQILLINIPPNEATFVINGTYGTHFIYELTDSALSFFTFRNAKVELNTIEFTRASDPSVADGTIEVDGGYLYCNTIFMNDAEYGLYIHGEAEVYGNEVTILAPAAGHSDSLVCIVGNSYVELTTYTLEGYMQTGNGIYVAQNASVKLTDFASNISNMAIGIHNFDGGRVFLQSKPVMTGNTDDFNVPVNCYSRQGSLTYTEDFKVNTLRMFEYDADGAIEKYQGTALLSKAGAGAYTLAAPTSSQNGMTINIVSTTANAHVVTATNLIHDGVTGGAKDTMTFAAFPGASIVLQAINFTWHVLSNNNVAVA